MRALLIAAVLMLAVPAAASAMNEAVALTRGIEMAHVDCDGPDDGILCGDIVGLPFPDSATVDRCNDTSRWCVEVWYRQWDITGERSGRCVTNTHFEVRGNDLTYHTTGCSGINEVLP